MLPDPDWEFLKKLVGSAMARYTILVPIVGWILVYQGEMAALMGRALGLESSPFSFGDDGLYFYLGLIIIGFVSAGFRIFCPEEVQNNQGLSEYVHDLSTYLTRAQFLKFCDENSLERPDDVEVDPLRQRGAPLSRQDWLSINSIPVMDTLSFHYQTVNKRSTIVRYLFFALFVVGALLTLKPTFTTIGWALSEIMS